MPETGSLPHIDRTHKTTIMKEPKVQVGILFEPQIKFILLTPYHINGEEVSG